MSGHTHLLTHMVITCSCSMHSWRTKILTACMCSAIPAGLTLVGTHSSRLQVYPVRLELFLHPSSSDIQLSLQASVALSRRG